MAFQYCDECETAMEYPSIAEIIVGTRFCPSCKEECGMLVDDDERINEIDAFIEKIKRVG